MGSKLSRRLHSPASEQDKGPASPRVESGLCCMIIAFFLVSCPLVDEAGLVVWSLFLVGGVHACPMVGGSGSWPSGRLGHGLGVSPEPVVGSSIFRQPVR